MWFHTSHHTVSFSHRWQGSPALMIKQVRRMPSLFCLQNVIATRPVSCPLCGSALPASHPTAQIRSPFSPPSTEGVSASDPCDLGRDAVLAGSPSPACSSSAFPLQNSWSELCDLNWILPSPRDSDSWLPTARGWESSLICPLSLPTPDIPSLSKVWPRWSLVLSEDGGMNRPPPLPENPPPASPPPTCPSHHLGRGLSFTFCLNQPSTPHPWDMPFHGCLFF